MKVARRRQISAYLENRPGALAEICDLIERERINLLAMCAIDMVEDAVVRLVPEEPERVARALEDKGFRVIDCDVLIVDLPNRAGSAGRVAGRLAATGINIDYLYASSHPDQERTVLALRTQALDEAEATLRETDE